MDENPTYVEGCRNILIDLERAPAVSTLACRVAASIMADVRSLLELPKAFRTRLRRHVFVDNDHCIDTGQILGEMMRFGVRSHQDYRSTPLHLDRLEG